MSSSVRFDNSSPINSPVKDGQVEVKQVGIRREGVQEEAYQLHTNQTAIQGSKTPMQGTVYQVPRK